PDARLCAGAAAACGCEDGFIGLSAAGYQRFMRSSRTRGGRAHPVSESSLGSRAMRAMFSSLGRPAPLSSVLAEPVRRFDSAAAVVISNADELAAMRPGFVRSLSAEFDVDALAGRISPVLLDDQSVAIFSLAEHVGSDQADELARRVKRAGYRLAEPARYVLAAPLLLAVARSQLTPRSLAGAHHPLLAESKTALAEAFQDLLAWGVRHDASDIHLN